jgi:hypothetical protein
MRSPQGKALVIKEGFSYMGFLIYTRSLPSQIPHSPC